MNKKTFIISVLVITTIIIVCKKVLKNLVGEEEDFRDGPYGL